MKILVVKLEDSFLPKGAITSVLPDDQNFSDYEINCGLWEVVEGIDEKDLKNKSPFSIPNPLPPPESHPDGKPGHWKETIKWPKESNAVGDKHICIYEDGKIKKKPKSQVYKKPKGNEKPFDHPNKAGLDRSHSTIWDYGYGRTYTSPQTAFEALYTLVGSTPFTEDHYIRGWQGTYLSQIGLYWDREVLNIHDVKPTRDYRLIVDTNPGDLVVFDGRQANHPAEYCIGIVNSHGSYTDIVDYVDIRDIQFTNCTAMIWCNTRLNNICKDWRFDHIQTYLAGSYPNYNGISMNGLIEASILNCFLYIPDAIAGVAGVSLDALEDDVGEFFTFANNIFVSSGPTQAPGILVDGRDVNPWMILCNNTFYNCSYGILVGFNLSGITQLRLGCFHNNSVGGNMHSFILIDDNDLDARLAPILNMDFNVYYPNEYFLRSLGGGRSIDDFEEWKSFVQGDANSYNADPDYNDPENTDFSLKLSSPGYGTGNLIGNPDLFGTDRIKYDQIDIGAVNHSLGDPKVICAPRINKPSLEEREEE